LHFTEFLLFIDFSIKIKKLTMNFIIKILMQWRDVSNIIYKFAKGMN